MASSWHIIGSASNAEKLSLSRGYLCCAFLVTAKQEALSLTRNLKNHAGQGAAVAPGQEAIANFSTTTAPAKGRPVFGTADALAALGTSQTGAAQQTAPEMRPLLGDAAAQPAKQPGVSPAGTFSSSVTGTRITVSVAPH